MRASEEASTRARRIAERLLAQGAIPPQAPVPPMPPRPIGREAERAAPGIDYAHLQHRVRWLDGALQLYRAAARAIADQTIAAAADDEPGETVDEAQNQLDPPGGGDRAMVFVRKAHRILLEHPVAAKHAFAAIAREGRAFAATAEGADLRDRLLRSRRVRRASLLWRSLTMGMLDEDDTGELPSTYLDNLLRAVDRPDLERLLGQLHLEGKRP